MKNKISLLALLACALSSCKIYVPPKKSVAPARVFEPFGSMTAKQVESLCNSYAETDSDIPCGDYVYLVKELGVFGDGNIYVDTLKLDLSKLSFAVGCVCVDVVLYGTYILTLPDPSYSVNVYVDGVGSYSLKNAYDRGIITDDDVKEIARWNTFDTPLEDFSFSLKWGCGPEHSYDSKTEVLVKDRFPVSDGLTAEDYTTTYHYPDLEGLYENIKTMNIYSFPINFDPYEGSNLMTDPSCSYILHVGQKTICADRCPLVSGYPDGLMPQGKKFLMLVFDIIDTIQNSDEWKSLPDQKPRYM